MLARNKPITSSVQLQTAIKEKDGLDVDKKMIRLVLRKDLRLGFRMAKTVPV